MTIICSDSTGPRITSGTLGAAGQIMDFRGSVNAIDHVAPESLSTGTWLVFATDEAASQDFPMLLTMTGALDPTGGVIAYQALPMVGYLDGGTAEVAFTRFPPAMPGAAANPLSWSEMDGRELADGDRITADTYPLGVGDPLFILESGSEVNWWKSLYLFNPRRNAASLMCKTNGSGQTSRSPVLAVPAGPYTGPSLRVPLSPGGVVIDLPLYGLSEWEAFSSDRLIFHKPKFLGSDTPIYSLEMRQAPHSNFGRVGWRFVWEHQ